MELEVCATAKSCAVPASHQGTDNHFLLNGSKEAYSLCMHACMHVCMYVLIVFIALIVLIDCMYCMDCMVWYGIVWYGMYVCIMRHCFYYEISNDFNVEVPTKLRTAHESRLVDSTLGVRSHSIHLARCVSHPLRPDGMDYLGPWVKNERPKPQMLVKFNIDLY